MVSHTPGGYYMPEISGRVLQGLQNLPQDLVHISARYAMEQTGFRTDYCRVEKYS